MPHRPEAALWRPPVVPASFFGIPLGTLALSLLWRDVATGYGLSPLMGNALFALGAVLWVCILGLYGLKWLYRRAEARAELDHPVQCCFIGLAGVTTMLLGIATAAWPHGVAALLVCGGGVWTLAFAVWRTGHHWRGDRDLGAVTAVLYLPAVAGGFVAATALATLGYPSWGQFAFGVAALSWLSIEPLLLHRLFTATLPAALRPTLGIALAPPAVGAVAYLAVSGGRPDMLAHALIGYALFQALVLIGLARWLFAAGMSLSMWSFTFGVAALPTAVLRLGAAGDAAAAALAPALIAAGTLVVAAVAITSLMLAVRQLRGATTIRREIDIRLG